MMKKNKTWLLALALSAVFTASTLLPSVSLAATVVEGTTETSESSTPNQTDDSVISEGEEVELTADELDFENYLDQLLAIAQYEEKAFSALPSTLYISSSNRKSLFLKFNNTVVPNYTKYVSQLKQIKPENVELQKIHNKLTRGSYNQLEGYLLYKRALSKYTINRTLLTQGNAKVKTGQELIEQSKEEFDEYAEQLGYE
ncbi:hypothetical protein [Paenibacillus urinalis]|uniref:Uncharacterized protein n=1 Tax=Paenibacillus urinalis TaxID=521520 RepID=A0AAX3MVN2_9BACL|nr:hypothetical protein [Paenibacillus urinalis]WDH80475.1 hypothetical protein PUW23_12940 [Paenibacillus urinalis]